MSTIITLPYTSVIKKGSTDFSLLNQLFGSNSSKEKKDTIHAIDGQTHIFYPESCSFVFKKNYRIHKHLEKVKEITLSEEYKKEHSIRTHYCTLPVHSARNIKK